MPLNERNCLSCSVRGSQSFCRLSHEALAELQDIGSWMRYDKRQVIFHEGFSLTHVYAVCHGRIKVSACSADGRLLILRVASPGDVLGLASVLKSSRHLITAEALEPCAIKSIPRAAFFDFMHRFADVNDNIVASLVRELDSALLSARRLALSTSAAAKLAATLTDWAHSSPAPQSSFDMPLTHEELGNMSGLSRETVTRLLIRFRKDGLLALHGDHMTLLDPARLEALAA